MLAIPSWGVTGTPFEDADTQAEIERIIRIACGGDLCLRYRAADTPCLIKADAQQSGVVETRPPVGTKVARGSTVVFQCQPAPASATTAPS